MVFFLRCAELMLGFFMLCASILHVFSKTVRKQTKTRHNTCEACAGLYIAMSGFVLSNLGRGFSVHMGRMRIVLVQKV